jgi:3-oxoacyl-[acyl-carrier-protein] synthase III
MALGIFGIGIELPPRRDTRSLIAECGGDPSQFGGWRNICIADEADHPSDMAARALRQALAAAAIPPSKLRLLLSVGVSRDYPPSWSLATEVMRLVSAPATCIGLDTTIGCLGMLSGLHLALGWLTIDGGGYAALVSAERWSHTVNRSDVATKALWGHADGASAIIVGAGIPDRPLVRFLGASFTSHADYNGLILIKHGGTRYPVPTSAAQANGRLIKSIPPSELWENYRRGFSRALESLRARFEVPPSHLLCNQISPNVVSMVAEIAGVPRNRVCETGHETGHVGSSDIIIGLHQLLDDGKVDGPIVALSSTPYAFGAGLLMPSSST